MKQFATMVCVVLAMAAHAAGAADPGVTLAVQELSLANRVVVITNSTRDCPFSPRRLADTFRDRLDHNGVAIDMEGGIYAVELTVRCAGGKAGMAYSAEMTFNEPVMLASNVPAFQKGSDPHLVRLPIWSDHVFGATAGDEGDRRKAIEPEIERLADHFGNLWDMARLHRRLANESNAMKGGDGAGRTE